MGGMPSQRVHRNIIAFASIAAMVALTVLMLPVVASAFRSARGVALPDPLALVLRKLPVVFPVHMVASACALLLVPLAIASWRCPSIHRWVGRSAAICILVGGLASLIVAFVSMAAPLARAAFFCQGVVWLVLMVAGVRAIRHKDRARHAQLMRAVAIVTVSPVLLRLLMHVVVSTPRSFDRTYSLLAWGVWLLPLIIYGLVAWVRERAANAAQLPGMRQVAGPHI